MPKKTSLYIIYFHTTHENESTLTEKFRTEHMNINRFPKFFLPDFLTLCKTIVTLNTSTLKTILLSVIIAILTKIGAKYLDPYCRVRGPKNRLNAEKLSKDYSRETLFDDRVFFRVPRKYLQFNKNYSLTLLTMIDQNLFLVIGNPLCLLFG